MPTFPHWTLSQESRSRMTELLRSATDLGLDREAVSAGGLAALRAVIALRRARDAGEGAGREQQVARVQEALRGLDPNMHGDLLQQVQARILALQGRRGDTAIAHVQPGEMVIPRQLQTRAVIGALRRAAADIALEELRIGSVRNNVNPRTRAPEFFNARDSDDEEEGFSGAAEGAAARSAPVDIITAQKRAEYAAKVSALHPDDIPGRTGLKIEYRPQTPMEMRALIADDPTGPPLEVDKQDGKMKPKKGSANKTNPVVDGFAKGLGMAGKGLGALGVVSAAADVATSKNPTRAAIANVGAVVGGTLGGLAGAALGGPAAPVTGPFGAAGGGHAGYEAGEALYDALAKKRR